MKFSQRGLEFICGLVDLKRSSTSDTRITAEFRNLPEVQDRMKEVCGATAFSYLLRNSEHVARYIQTGSWISHEVCEMSLDRESEGLAAELLSKMTNEKRKSPNKL